MKNTITFSFAFLGCAVGGIEANFLRWSPNDAARRWEPAQETPQPLLELVNSFPLPTEAPQEHIARDLVKRRTSICGYASGIASLSYTCGSDDCLYNSVASVLGCGQTIAGKSYVATTCYDSTQKSLFTSDNGLTRYCGNSQYPYCYTWTYKDPEWTGYSIFDCDIARGTKPIYYLPTDTTITSTTSTKIISTTTTSTTSPISSTTTSSSTTTTAPPTPVPDSPSTPVAAIAGGVVGGVAVIGLIGLGIFFILRRSKNKSPPPPAAPTVSAVNTGYQGPPPTGGQGGYAVPPPAPAPAPQMAAAWATPIQQQQGFPPAQGSPVSMMKGFDTSYNPSVAPISPVGSPPPPHSPQSVPGYDMVTTPSSHDNYRNSHAASPPYVVSTPGTTELPTSRPDRALQELA